MTLLYTSVCNEILISHSYFSFPNHAGNVEIQCVEHESPSHDVTPMQGTSPLCPSNDYEDVNEDIQMNEDPRTVPPPVCADPSSILEDDRNEPDIPDSVLLEVHIPIPSSSAVQDPLSVATRSEAPVSYPSIDIL